MNRPAKHRREDVRPELVRATDPGAGPGPRWADRVVLLALMVVVAATMAVAINTTLIHWRTDSIRAMAASEITPARNAAADLVVASALEMDALYRYALTADLAALSEYQKNAAARRLAASLLRTVADDLDGEMARRTEVLLQQVARWDREVPAVVSRRVPSVQVERRLGSLQAINRAVLLDATALERTLNTELEGARTRIDAAELLDWYYTLSLVGVALGASVLIVLLVRRVRLFASVAEQRRTQAERATASRARLMRGVTHDLKDPLGAADGAAALMETGVHGPLTDSQRDMVARIRRGITAALAIVSDLLDLSRTEAGQLDIEVSATDVSEVLTHVANEYRLQAEAVGLVVECKVPAGLPPIASDGRRVRGIISNLVSNAVKYTPSGGHVMLRAEMRTDGAAPGAGPWMALSVTDTGPGIPPLEREKIFEEFHRADTGAETAGVGLGLAISRSISRLLGGEITVEGARGGGSVFTLWLPLDEARIPRRAAS